MTRPKYYYHDAIVRYYFICLLLFCPPFYFFMLCHIYAIRHIRFIICLKNKDERYICYICQTTIQNMFFTLSMTDWWVRSYFWVRKREKRYTILQRWGRGEREQRRGEDFDYIFFHVCHERVRVMPASLLWEHSSRLRDRHYFIIHYYENRALFIHYCSPVIINPLLLLLLRLERERDESPIWET